ncbi:family 43 glycosylhydrolase [Gorillibacterium massiliense]|uniref:family 43 glycosylhydrolase n=1 Tax=Gorillibacterium massiliense TaxID=1280390 RepID=UPI0004B5707D|nr:family 43 glycosylhydrolase [Gorillibacterium massiliense]
MNHPSDYANRSKERAGNPIITSIFTADPSAHVWEDGKIYIYASHDMDPPLGCDLMDRYHVFSSDDMVNWTDEGEILRSDDVEWGRPEGGFMWAPDCAYRNGTYYFYFPHPSGSDWNSTWKIGVATCSEPAGKFVDQGYIQGLGGFAMIDPCVFVDDDNRPYLYYGGGGKCAGGELNDDMMSMKTGAVEMLGLEDFHEATWVFKRNGVYYLMYSDNLHDNNCMRYATSDNPLGPWQYQGIFLEPTGCSTTHGSVVEYKGHWYLFYHNQAVSDHGNLRSVCIDELYFAEDGRIRMVEQTKEGVHRLEGSGEQRLQPATVYQAASAACSGGAARAEEEAAVCLPEAGSGCLFEKVDGGDGGRAYVQFQYRTEESLAKLHLYVNGADWSLLNAPAVGSDGTAPGLTGITVELQPGTNNRIQVVSELGEICIEALLVSGFQA